MDELGYDIRKMCCTCLSFNRKLYQLCAIVDGINNLYALLSNDLDAYKEAFFKDSTKFYICWECKAVMSKIRKFKTQACIAQKQLSNIEDGKYDIKNCESLSALKITNKDTYDQEYSSLKEEDSQNYIFIDCGIITQNIKNESDDDIPLSELNKDSTETTEIIQNHSETEEFNQNYENHSGPEELIQNYSESDVVKLEYPLDLEDNENITKVKRVKRKSNREKDIVENKRQNTYLKRKRKRKTDAFSAENKKHYKIEIMSAVEMLECREKMRLKADYVDAPNKCESCIEGFKREYNFEKHMECHKMQPKSTQCKICLVYVRNVEAEEHRRMHYEKYVCKYCVFSSCEVTEVLRHLRNGHNLLEVVVPKRWKRGERKTPLPKNPGSRPRLNKPMMDKRTALGYRCSDCDQYFNDKKQRWTHVQKMHREGFKCATCGKRFSFKNHLQKHLRLHQGPAERTACPECGKLIQVALLATHARLHMPRKPYNCVACDKRFISRESYNVHLKYSIAHAKEYVLKYKCDHCEKGYRSKVELADHINYKHMGKTHHKCPMCNKPLASRKCIARHIRTTHYGIHESPRDKVCQQCGKTFRDKKGLREHERIHTGERPLSCEVCGCTFRQSSSLYTHKKKIHKIFPKKKTVQVVEEDCDVAGISKHLQVNSVLSHS